VSRPSPLDPAGSARGGRGRGLRLPGAYRTPRVRRSRSTSASSRSVSWGCAPASRRSIAWWLGRYPFGDRTWAIEGAGGPGYLLAQQLVAGGEHVVDVPAKLGARVRLLATGDATRRSQRRPIGCRGGLRSPTVGEVRAEDHVKVKRHHELASQRTVSAAACTPWSVSSSPAASPARSPQLSDGQRRWSLPRRLHPGPRLTGWWCCSVDRCASWCCR
jgi:hypothetical protein